MSIAVCYCGPIDEGEQVLRPLRTFQPAVEDGIQPMPYAVLQSARDEGFPSGRLHYWKSGWLREVTDGAIETLMQFLPQMPSSASSVGLQRLHGVASRVPHRPPPSHIGPSSTTSSSCRSGPRRPTRIATWSGPGPCSRRCEPHLEESVYVNNLGDEGPGRVQAAYGENYPRLAAMKRTYDPDNLFRANQNIDPSSR